MEEKIGAGGEPQTYNPDDGRYTGKGTTYRQNTSYAEILQNDKKNSRILLSKQEWAQYYKKLAEIEAGTFRERRLSNGDRVVIVGNKFIIDNGQFVSPRVKSVTEFRTNEALNDYLNLIEAEGMLKWD